MRQIYKNINRNFVARYSISNKIQEEKVNEKTEIKEENEVVKKQPVNNKKKTKRAEMTTEQISAIEEAASKMEVEQPVKVVKKDRGLIERTESSKIILTEDNRQVLVD